MKIIFALLICGLVHKSIEQDGNPLCCITYYEKENFAGDKIRYCDGNETCINLPEGWENRISSVGLENWRNTQNTETTLFSHPGCTGNAVHVKAMDSCAIDLGFETWLDSIGIHNDRCGYKGMDNNADSIIIYCSKPYEGRLITDYQIKVQYFDKLDKVIDDKISETKNFLDIANAALDLLSLVPFLDAFVGLIKFFEAIFVDDTDSAFMEYLEWAITTIARRETAMEGFRSMNATMKVVAQNMMFLNNSNSTNADRVSTVHNIHDGLFEVVSRLYDEKSIYRDYPMTVLNTLFGLTSIISLFHPIVNVISPTIVNDSKLFCDQYNALILYQTLAVKARLDSFEYMAVQRAKPFIEEVKNRTYNPNGYLNGETKIKCLDQECQHEYQCLYDPTNKKGVFSQSGDVKECFLVYAELVRTRTEEAFAKPIELAKRFCNK